MYLFPSYEYFKNEIVACWRLYVCPTCISRARFFAFAAFEWRDFSQDPMGVRFLRWDALVAGHSDFQHVISKGQVRISVAIRHVGVVS